jgi:hypothetical protein
MFLLEHIKFCCKCFTKASNGGMTIRVLAQSGIPKPTRNRFSPLRDTEDWREAIQKINELRGKKRGAFAIEFDPETLALGKDATNTSLTFKRLLQRFLEQEGIAELFQLSFRGQDVRGNRVLYVLREGER